jgi:quercetin dioxygenase-like cupin family protein
MDLGTEFIRLPWRFEAARMAEEIRCLPESAWMPHPDGTPGNTAVALISRGGGDNDQFRGAMQPTRHLLQCEYLQQVIASFGEVFGRSRLMRLAPGAEVVPHVDFHHHWHNHLRVHIPVITNPQVLFYCGERHVNMQAGECWIFDSWRRHRVVNGGSEARVHLVIDTAGSARFWDTADRAREAAAAGAPLVATPVEYRPGVRAEITTERYNLQPVMSPGEIDGLTEDLIAEMESVPQNDPERVALYRRLMRGFCKDWRALWYRFGLHQPGWPHYAQLVAQTSRAMPEFDPPMLLPNRMGDVKRAFGGRVLAVSLSRDVYAEFVAVPRAAPTD